MTARLNPTNHLELALVHNQRWVNVLTAAAIHERLFVARVSGVQATYTFTTRLFLRTIGQYISTDRNPSLYIDTVAARSGTFSGSALLAYKINWQSVLFLGYGDDRELSAERRLEHVDRQVFVKLSHAFQR